jgi:hypothetical protein
MRVSGILKSFYDEAGPTDPAAREAQVYENFVDLLCTDADDGLLRKAAQLISVEALKEQVFNDTHVYVAAQILNIKSSVKPKIVNNDNALRLKTLGKRDAAGNRLYGGKKEVTYDRMVVLR